MNSIQRPLYALAVLCAPAFADTTTTPGPWDLYYNSTLMQGGFGNESSCVNAASAYDVTRTYTCRTRTTVAVTQNAAPPAPPPPPPSGAVTYTTNFDSTEFPISEGGRWHRANNPWTSVRSANGTAYGSNGVTNGYDDSYALLSGFGPNQTVEAVVQVNPGTVGPSHEVELLLRFSDDNSNARGYEVDFWLNGTVQVMRWNGPFGPGTDVATSGGPVPWTQAVPLKTGDVIKAQMIGNRIQVWHNGVLKADVIDNAFATGQPGMGFFIRPGGSNNLLTLTRYTASSN